MKHENQADPLPPRSELSAPTAPERSWGAATGPRPDLARRIVKALWIILGAAGLTVALLLLVGGIHLSQTGTHFLTALIYSAAIGLPSVFLLTWFSFRYMAQLPPRLTFAIDALLLLATATAGCLAADVLLRIAGVIRGGGYWAEFRSSVPYSIFLTLIIGLTVSSYETMRHRLQAATLELRARQVEQERAQKLLAETRLSSLESRIHPHFLFNTLNSIAALIPTDPQRAEDTVGRLASLLRFSLNANHGGLVPLAQEGKIVRDYLEIEATRFGPRLRYEIVMPEAAESLKVPPAALQTLVENCVRHVVAQRPQGASIRVEASVDAGRVRLRVADDGPGFSLEAMTPEHGLGNLAARLALVFGEAGKLEVQRESGGCCVQVSFPVQP
jgi:sensor histidine kinase YesM